MCPGGGWRTLSEWKSLFATQRYLLIDTKQVGASMHLMVWEKQEWPSQFSRLAISLQNSLLTLSLIKLLFKLLSVRSSALQISVSSRLHLILFCDMFLSLPLTEECVAGFGRPMSHSFAEYSNLSTFAARLGFSWVPGEVESLNVPESQLHNRLYASLLSSAQDC